MWPKHINKLKRNIQQHSTDFNAFRRALSTIYFEHKFFKGAKKWIIIAAKDFKHRQFRNCGGWVGKVSED
jgi:hypothetical protein